MIIYTAILIIFGLILCILIKYFGTRFTSVINKIIFSISCGLLCTLLIITVPPIAHGMVAIKKGLEEEKVLMRTDFSEIYELNGIMPDDNSFQALNSVLTNNDVIMFYRYDCPACKEEIEYLTNYFGDKKVYWCSSRSHSGKALLDKFANLNISSVPSAVYKIGEQWILKEFDI